MASWFSHLDDLLRGRQTAPELLKEGRLDLPLSRFVPLAILFGAAYGFFAGWYAVLRGADDAYWQALAAMVKIPALFLLTLVVTFPSLYVFNALVGCRLSFTANLRLLVAAVVINVTVAASFGPILGFFTLSTTSYSFMVLLNVALLAVAGLVALGFLLHTLRRLAVASMWSDIAKPTNDTESANGNQAARQPGPLESNASLMSPQALGQARNIFRIWVVIYALVGAQMAWLLRPFIGSPGMPFTWLREREGNFFESVSRHLTELLGG